MNEGPLKPNKESFASAGLDRREKILFPYLDTLAKAIDYIISAYPPPNLLIGSEQSGRELIVEPRYTLEESNQWLNKLKDLPLSERQIGILDEYLQQLRARHQRVEELSNSYSDRDILNGVWHKILQKPEHTHPDTRGTTLIKTPLAFAIILRSDTAIQNWHVRGLGLNTDINTIRNIAMGAFVPHNDVDNDGEGTSWHNTFFFVIPPRAGEIDDINATLQHEYLHSLYAEFVKFTDAHSYFRNDTPDLLYPDPQAREIFNNIKDELFAYTYGSGRLVIPPDDLVPINATLDEALSQLDYTTAKEIKTLVLRILSQLKLAQEYKLDPKQLGLIVLTSENLNQAVKRLEIYLKDKIK